MKNVYFLLCILSVSILFHSNSNAQGSCTDGGYQWSDVTTIFQNNGCAVADCHDASAASGLDLSTFAGFNAGGTKCTNEISSGTTLVDIIQTGGVACSNGTITNAMNSNIANPVPATDIAAIQAWIDSGAFENCRGVPEDDGYADCGSSIGALDADGQTNLCIDGSNNPPTLNIPTGTLADVEIAIEVGGLLNTISPDGSFDTTELMPGDEICYTAFNYDLAAIQMLLETANGLCPTLDILFPDLLPCAPIGDLIAGNNDGNPGLNDLLEVLDFAASLSAPIGSVQSAVSVINTLNETITPLNLGPICYATSNNVCLIAEECTTSTCPVVYLNDDNLPSLPAALCEGDLLSLCFDLLVDPATFDPSLVEFNYNLTIGGNPSALALTNSFVVGAQIDPNANGQICFEAIVPDGADPCQPSDVSLEILSVFYRDDVNCPSNTIGFVLNLSALPPSSGDDLNDLVPLLTLAGFNPLILTAYPNPIWLANITLPACDGTLGTIEILAADGTTVCETLTDVGTAGMDGCPPTDAILPETVYTAFETFTVPDQNDMDSVVVNPCAVNITVFEQIIPCEDQCVECPTVVNVIPTENVCHNFASPISFCVEFDIEVDANTVLTIDGVSIMDGSAGGTQICIDFIPYIPLLDPCSSSTLFYSATVICGGTDLLEGIVWPDTQILPITDPACGGIAGCTNPDATNYDPDADCDDGSCIFEMCNDECAPNFGAPEACEPYDMTCNTDCTMGDIEIWEVGTCSCVVDIITVLGCTDQGATNFEPTANCDDGSCIFEMCDDPCAPNFGAPEACEPYDMTCNTDCTLGDIEVWDTNQCSCVVDIPTVLGCTEPDAANYEPTANCDDGSCIFEMCEDPCAPNFGAPEACEPYDMTCNTDCTLGDTEVWDAATCSCIISIPTVLGCTDDMAINFDLNANCDDGSCIFFMCEDPCAPNFGAPETCEPYDTSCNTDCTMGDIEVWDATSCECVVDIPTVSGCTDPDANNYDPNANCDDGTCIFLMCEDPCAPNFGAAELCEPYDTSCNDDCFAGPFGGSWNPASCACINQITPVIGCTEPLATNYNPDANCDDGSCFCEEEIVGSIIVPDEGCDVSGLEVMIMAPDGTSIIVITDANGSFTVPGGPFPCGMYSATITDADIPACFTETGDIGPVQFEVDGQGSGNDGPFFFANPEVPTLSQWGLIILALLLMTFGALKLGFQFGTKKESIA